MKLILTRLTLLVLLLPTACVAVNEHQAITTYNINVIDKVAEQVAPGIYDDGKATAFLKININDTYAGQVAQVFQKKGRWQEMYPRKRIITMTSITQSNHSDLAGLLIHYEITK